MLNYLVNYGVQKTSFNYEDVDINDRLQLQDQINTARRNYNSLIHLLDEVQGKYLDCSSRMSERVKELVEQNNGVKNNTIFSSDDIYLSIETEMEALKAGMQMINSQIDYYKNDLRILNSVFYNKF